MKLTLLFFALLVAVSPVCAYDGLFEILDETVYNGSFAPAPETQPPNISIQTSQHIYGWVDIVGFRDTVTIDNTEYCYEINPVVKYSVWSDNLGWDNAEDYIEVTEIRNYTLDNLSYSDIDIHLRWYHSTLKTRVICTFTGCRLITWIQKDYYDEYATFTNSINTPQQFPGIYSEQAVVTIYDNSYNPYVNVYLPVQWGETKTVYTYGTETFTRYNLAGTVSDSTVYLSDCLFWDNNTDLFKTKNENLILKLNKSEFDISNLNIVVYSPYEVRNITDYRISTIDNTPDKQINESGIILPIIILLIFGWGVKKCWTICGDL